MANNLTKSGLTLGSKTANYTAEFNSEDFELMKLPLWSEVATATSGDIVIPDCTVDVDSFASKYSNSSITSFKTGALLECSRVTDMSNMFYYCTSLTSADLRNFDTSSITSMTGMFYNCPSLISLNLSNFDTSNVTSMLSMFNLCSSLTSLDLSNFDTSNVTDMESMFFGCTSLTNLTLSNKWGAGLVNQSNEFDRIFSLSTTAITKTVANDILSKLANVIGGVYKPIVIFKSSLGLSASEIAVGTNKGWDVQTV